jgi:large subunit ribosomal protein L21
MLAIIKTGGKEYIVKEGDTLRIEKLEVEEGKTVKFDQVLMASKEDGSGLQVGMPTVSGAVVEGMVTKQGRADKVIVRKFRAKVRYSKTYGHRQPFTEVKISKVSA